jgi:uncharacterized protein
MNILRNYAFALVSILCSLHTSNAQERSQTPIEPFPYKTIEVKYQVKTDSTVQLAGTLTIPEGKGKFAAILIIGGSGQTSRDQPYYNHKMMLVLSDFLTRQGYATLRFDDRGAGKSTPGIKKFSQLVESDYLADASAGLDFLKKHPMIDGSKIGIIGHSAGALQGLALASEKENRILFSVMLAGAVNNHPHKIVAHQSEMMAKASKKSQRLQIADSIFVARSILYTISEPVYENRFKSIRTIADQELSKLSTQEQQEVKKSFDTRVNILSSEQFHKAAQEDQVDYLLKVKCPVLLILGTKDLNVDADYYGPRMKASLKKNYNSKSKLHIIPGINHLMQAATTGLAEESKDISETISPIVLETVGKWLSNVVD